MTTSGTQTRDAIDAPCDIGYTEELESMKIQAATKATDFNKLNNFDFKTVSFINKFCKPSIEELNTLYHTEWIRDLV
jgi:hypothetical protein